MPLSERETDRAEPMPAAPQPVEAPPAPANENTPIDPNEFWRRLGL